MFFALVEPDLQVQVFNNSFYLNLTSNIFRGDLCEISTIAITTPAPVTTAPAVADCPSTIRLCQNGGSN